MGHDGVKYRETKGFGRCICGSKDIRECKRKGAAMAKCFSCGFYIKIQFEATRDILIQEWNGNRDRTRRRPREKNR